VSRVIDERYTILEPMGVGRFGQVFRARQHGVVRDVALKLVSDHLIRKDDLIRRFKSEARLAGQRNHPAIVGVLDFGASPGLVYVVTELVTGPTFAELIEAEGALDPARVVHVAVQILDALDAAHNLDIAHRNLRADKIKVFDNPPWHDSAKILGFGFGESLTSHDQVHTEVNVNHYTPPERALGQPYDARSDLYSVGAIAYEALSGRPPFAHVGSDLELLQSHAYSPAPPLPPTVPQRLVSLIMRLLAKKREDRPESAALARELMLASVGSVPPSAEPREASGLASPTEPAQEAALPITLPSAPEEAPETDDPVAWDDATGSLLLDPETESKLRDASAAPAQVVFKSASQYAMTQVLVGTVLDDRYELVEQIGKGGFGQVFLGRQTTVERDVAVKVISPTLLNDEEAAKRFEREARLSGSLSHPNIVQTIAFGHTSDGLYYLVMEYVKGRTLKELIAEERRFEVPRAIRIAAQISDALEAAHKSDIIHRDLKPSNVMLMDDVAADFVKILDYGLAKSLGEQSAITRHNSIFGSPAYMPPEMVLNRSFDRRGDMYSLGVVLYEMLTGTTPFASSDNPFDLMRAHVYEEPPALPSHVPPQVRRMMSKLLAKEPDDRYADIAELREALAECPGMEPLSSPAMRMLPQRTRTSPSLPSIPAIDTVRERLAKQGVPKSMASTERQIQDKLAAEKADADGAAADVPANMVMVGGQQVKRASLFDPSEAETNIPGTLPSAGAIAGLPEIGAAKVEVVDVEDPTKEVTPPPNVGVGSEPVTQPGDSSMSDIVPDPAQSPASEPAPRAKRSGVPIILVLVLMGLMLGLGVAIDRYMARESQVIEAPQDSVTP